MYFTTITNKYGLKVIEHVQGEGNADFVNSSGLAWIEVDEEEIMPATGDYWHNEQIIKLDSDEYETIIAPILHEAREVENVVLDAKAAELAAEKARLLAEQEEGAGDPIVPDPDPAVLDISEQKIIAKQARKPVYIPIREQDEIPPYTQATLDLYTEMLADTGRMIAGIEGDTDPDPDIVRFPEPITFLDGTPEEHTLEYIVLADEDKDEFLAHWNKVKEDQQAFVTFLTARLAD
ncbi:hypothetical protein OAA64_01370 [bacterium]|nr:hypothetical protein [bacterium]